MGFTTGLVSSMGYGVPHYYIDTGGNQWDANTYCSIIFDGSGSMNNIIPALESAMGGDYFSSGSAAGGNGVKNTNSVRSTVQDYYATGGIEGAPDYNTNNATNGKDEFEKHVNFKTLYEDTAQYMATPLKYDGVSTWPAGASQVYYNDTHFITPSNFIQIVVCNESNAGYTDSLYGHNWGTNEQTTNWRNHITNLRNTLSDSGVNWNGSSATTQAGGRADSAKPSFTLIYMDPGMNSIYHTGPQLDNNSYGSTASQRLWVQGARDGGGLYALDGHTSGYNYGLADLDSLTAWNGKQNKLFIDALFNKSSETSVSYWKGRLISALQQNIIV